MKKTKDRLARRRYCGGIDRKAAQAENGRNRPPVRIYILNSGS